MSIVQSELDSTSGVPLYRQIKEILRAEISTGVAESDTPMTEAQLLERFDVSRAPIRQALKELADEGYVYRKQGKGTFPVTGVRVDRPANLRSGDLYRFLEAQGLNPTSKVRGIERIAAPAAVSRRLHLLDNERVIHFTRVIAVEGRPFAQMQVYVRAPESFLPTEAELDNGGTAFALLEKQYGIVLDRSEHEAWATAATQEHADALGVAVGSPLLVIDTVFYSRGGVPAGWRSAVHAAEEFKFHFETP